jgi:hypothetical protein
MVGGIFMVCRYMQRQAKFGLTVTYDIIIFARTNILTNGYQINFKIKQ